MGGAAGSSTLCTCSCHCYFELFRLAREEQGGTSEAGPPCLCPPCPLSWAPWLCQAPLMGAMTSQHESSCFLSLQASIDLWNRERHWRMDLTRSWALPAPRQAHLPHTGSSMAQGCSPQGRGKWH